MKTEQEIKNKLDELRKAEEKIWASVKGNEASPYAHDAFNEACNRSAKVFLLEWVLDINQ